MIAAIAAQQPPVATDTLIQLLVATAGSGVLVAMIQGFFTRRKTRAEVQSTGANATKLITDAAASVVDRVQIDNIALRTEVANLRAEVLRLGRWRDAAEDNFDRHERWDTDVANRLRDRGLTVDDPPPLSPAAERAT